MDGVDEVQALIDQYNAVMARWSDPDADYEAIGAGAERARGQDQRRRRVEPRAQRRDRDGRPALPAGRRRRRDALRRREAPRGAVPAAPPAPGPAPARRADEPPRRRVGRVAGAVPRRVRRAPSSPITHDRYFLDNVAKWILELDRGRGIPFSGNYSSWLEQKLERMAREPKTADARQRTLARELEWVRLGAAGPPGQGQGPPRRLRAAARRGAGRQGQRPASSRSRSRPVPASATRSSRSRTCARATATGC